MRFWLAILLLSAIVPLCADYSVSVDDHEVPPMQIGPSSGLYDAAYWTLHNTGDPNTYNVAPVNNDDGPAMITFCDDAGNCYSGSHEFDLAADEQIHLHANVIAQGVGMTRYSFLITSPNIDQDIELQYTYITQDVQSLVVVSDLSVEPYYTSQLENAGITFGVWEVDRMKLNTEAQSAFCNIIWSTEGSDPALDSDDISFLQSFLDDGSYPCNNLILTGQNIGADIGGETFYHDYLHATYREPASGSMVYGNPADPVSHSGMEFSLDGGEGAGNQSSQGIVDPAGRAEAMLFYDAFAGSDPAAIRSEHISGSRIVYCDFGIEGIAANDTRRLLLNRSLSWFGMAVDAQEQNVPASGIQLLQNSPNPFNPDTVIRFALDTPKEAELAIYDVRGRLVRTLADGVFDAGEHSLHWNGTDDDGTPVSSGVYLLRLNAGQQSLTRMINLLK